MHIIGNGGGVYLELDFEPMVRVALGLGGAGKAFDGKHGRITTFVSRALSTPLYDCKYVGKGVDGL